MEQPPRTTFGIWVGALALGVLAAALALPRDPVSALIGALAVAVPVAALLWRARRPEVAPPPVEVEPEETEPEPDFEQLGRLAGGIAHDFNNLLTGILGNTNLALKALAAGEARDAVAEADAAARRARELVSQVLAFSGRGGLELRPVDMGPLVAETAQLLQKAIAPQTRVVVEAPDGPRFVSGDPRSCARW
ncbi:MAG: histidine kinase dimerization/phospho-acceptor domain-containing protein [Myxococcota bacterium]